MESIGLRFVVVLLSCWFATTFANSPFGHEMLQEFMLAEGYVNLNHGSFGATPKEVIEYQQQLVVQEESYPDLWFVTDYKALVNEVRGMIASYINADEDEVVLIENASAGVNTILRSLNLQAGDAVLYLSEAYPMVVNVLKYLSSREGIELVEVPLHFPINDGNIIVEAVRKVLESSPKGKIKLASFSHISSMPAAILPIEELSKLCRSFGVAVFVDGAHALGQIPVDMKKLDPDYYLSNGHKWLYSPKGTAFLWVKKDQQGGIVPTVISTAGIQNFLNEFLYTGTRDYTPFCSISAAFKFRDKYGDSAIMEYMHKLAIDGGKKLAQLWNTELLVGEEMTGAMVNVILPTNSTEIALKISQRMFQDYNINFKVGWIPLQPGVLYTRISAQIYLEISDLQRAGELFVQLLNGN